MQPRESRETCPGCAAELTTRELRLHVCDWWRWLDHQVELRQDELQSFERQLGAYLDSPRGRFDLWCAARDRLPRPGPARQALDAGDAP
jgi:hypothetical protein